MFSQHQKVHKHFKSSSSEIPFAHIIHAHINYVTSTPYRGFVYI